MGWIMFFGSITMANNYRTKYRSRFQIYFGKYALVTLLIVMFGVILYFANYLINRTQDLRTGAAAGSAKLFFEPATATLPPNATINLWVTTDRPLAFAHVELSFDPSQLHLAQEISLPGPVLKALPNANGVTTPATITPMADANQTGHITVTLALDPATTTLASAPTGTFKLASFALAAATTTPGISTAFRVTGTNLQLVDTGAIPFAASTASSTLSLNPVPVTAVSPTPIPATTLDQTPPSVTLTSPSNNSTFRRGVRITLAATASDNVGVAKVQFYANGFIQCTDTVAPYTCSWKTPNRRKTYTLKAIAFDAEGNYNTSTIFVKIN